MACIQRGNDSTKRPFAWPAIGDARNTDAFVFFHLADDADRRERRNLQSPTKSSDQRLAVKINECFVAPESPAGSSSENKTLNVGFSSHG